MKFLIYGKGWIAGEVKEYMNREKILYEEGNSRVDDVENLEKELDEINPTNVICLIGRTHGKVGNIEYGSIDYLEQKGKLVENVRDNLFGPMTLAILCKNKNIHLTYLGTGCIFNYDDQHDTNNGFIEKDVPNFFDSSYSIVKGFTDRLMHIFPVCNARIRMPIVSKPNSRNFVTKILSYSKICSVDNSMTVLDDLIPILIDLSKRKFIGTINLTNPGVISHNEILELYKEIVYPEFTWQNFTYDEQLKVTASGRSNNYLDTSLLTSLYKVDDIKTSMRNVMMRMKEFINI